MRDFTNCDYCDYLWINDLLSLKKGQNNDFIALIQKSGREKKVAISNVVVLGTVVETKEIGEKGILYLIDDGTGIIACKYNDQMYNEIFDTIQEEQRQILNDTFNSKTETRSEISYIMSDDDTIFNDHTLQEEEAVAIQTNTLKALHSIWVDIEDSFSHMTRELNIGDTVVIHGRLYSFHNTNQIHVNVIRQIDLKEELILTSFKLEDAYEPVMQVQPDNLTNVQVIENNRRSGIMTFDHIHHLDIKEMPTSKFIISNNVSENPGNSKKRRSIVLPNLQGSMTFDTFTDLNDSGPQPKLIKM